MADVAATTLSATKVPQLRDTAESENDANAFYWIAESDTNFESLRQFNTALKQNLQKVFGKNTDLRKFEQECVREEQQQQQMTNRFIPKKAESHPQPPKGGRGGVARYKLQEAAPLSPSYELQTPISKAGEAMMTAPSLLASQRVDPSLHGVELPPLQPFQPKLRVLQESEKLAMSLDLNTSLCLIFDCVAEMDRVGAIQSQLTTSGDLRLHPINRKVTALRHQVSRTVARIPPYAFLHGLKAAEVPNVRRYLRPPPPPRGPQPNSAPSVFRPPLPGDALDTTSCQPPMPPLSAGDGQTVMVLKRRPGRPPKNPKLQKCRWVAQQLPAKGSRHSAPSMLMSNAAAPSEGSADRSAANRMRPVQDVVMTDCVAQGADWHPNRK